MSRSTAPRPLTPHELSRAGMVAAMGLGFNCCVAQVDWNLEKDETTARLWFGDKSKRPYIWSSEWSMTSTEDPAFDRKPITWKVPERFLTKTATIDELIRAIIPDLLELQRE